MSRDIERGHLGQGTFHLVKVRIIVDGQHIHQGWGCWARSPSPRLQAWGSRGVPYWTSGAHMGSWYSRHVWGFVPWQRFVLQDGGSPSRIETHGEVPRIKRSLTTVGVRLYCQEWVFQS